MTTTTTTTGVATLKQLNKECKKIDLEKVNLGDGHWVPPQIFSTDAEGKNPFIKFGGNGSSNGIDHEMFTRSNISQKWEYELSDAAPEGLWRNLKVLKFQGGKQGRRGFIHNSFTAAQILVNDNTDEILGVIYLLDNDYLNEWLRQTIDPNIRNNWDEIHAEKEFEVFITTTTYSQEKVKVVGRTYDECVKTMKQNDPMLDVGGMRNLFSGMKTTSNGKGAKTIPSSYDEWVSLNAKEVA